MLPTDSIKEISPTFDFDVRPVAGNVDVEVEADTPPHVLICVHGIRDDGAWGGVISAVAEGKFKDRKVEIVSARYKRLSSYEFILGLRRNEIRKDIFNQIIAIKNKYSDSEISLLCHSNGTKVIAEIISSFEFKFEWLFLCGSVCLVSDADRLKNLNRRPVNDAGVKDWWPVFAEALRPSLFSATGVNGFCRYPVKDRMFKYGHGGSTAVKHISEWILPTLANGAIRSTEIWDIGLKKHTPIYIRRMLFGIPLAAAIIWFLKRK